VGSIIFALLYFAILILLANFYTHKKSKTLQGFMEGGKSLSWALVALTFSLIPHGSGHTMSLWESSSSLGVSVYWWAIIAGGAFIPLLLLWFGPWVRQTGAETVSEVTEKLYGNKMRYVHACINLATWTGITMAETIAIGGAIYGLTGGAVPLYPWAIVIAFLLLVCYVVFGGILELVWISTINAVVMTVGSFLSLFFIGLWLTANAAGWDGVVQAYAVVDKSWMLNMFNFSPGIIYEVIVPVTVLHIAACSVAQGMYAPILSARSDADCRKGFYICTLSNVITAFPWVVIAIVGMTLPQFAKVGAKLVVFNLAMAALPTWLYSLMLVSLLAAVLSAVLVNDIIKRALIPDMSDETRMKLMRPMIILVGLLAAIPAFFAPILFPVFLWCFSFGIPIFVIFIYGLIWKTSNSAAWITLILAITVNFWWTFLTPSWASGPWALNMYPVTVVSFVLGTILFAVLPGEKGYLKRIKEAEADSASVSSN
jgi:SSS family solute:Na+ symporter